MLGITVGSEVCNSDGITDSESCGNGVCWTSDSVEETTVNGSGLGNLPSCVEGRRLDDLGNSTVVIILEFAFEGTKEWSLMGSKVCPTLEIMLGFIVSTNNDGEIVEENTSGDTFKDIVGLLELDDKTSSTKVTVAFNSEPNMISSGSAGSNKKRGDCVAMDGFGDRDGCEFPSSRAEDG